MERQDWLVERQKGIGGSDIGAILGIDPHKTPTDIFLSKVNNVIQEDNEYMFMGRLLEPVIAKRFEYETGYKTEKPDPEIITDPENKIFKASPDFYFLDNKGNRCVLECKSSFRDVSEPDPHYYTQVQWYLGITGAEYGYLAYLIAGYSFKYFILPRDDEFIDYLQEKVLEFWNKNVLTKIPPEAVNVDDLNNIIKRTKPEAKEANDEIVKQYQNLKKIKEQIKVLESTKDDLEFQIKNFMQEHETLEYQSLLIATWKQQTQNKIDSKMLKAVNPDVYHQFLKESTVRKFLLK